MQTDQQLRSFIERSSITSELKRHGFRGTGLTWTQSNGGIAHVIDFQRSRFSDSGSVKFTINIGVAVEDMWRMYYGKGFSKNIRVADCFPYFRVGEALARFQEKARDVWWTLVENNGSDELAAEVKAAVLENCLPILDRLDSVDAIFRFVREEAQPRHPHPYTRIAFAIICHLQGEVDLAKSELDELESNPRLGENWRTRIHDVRVRLGKARSPGA